MKGICFILLSVWIEFSSSRVVLVEELTEFSHRVPYGQVGGRPPDRLSSIDLDLVVQSPDLLTTCSCCNRFVSLSRLDHASLYLDWRSSLAKPLQANQL